MAQAIHCDAAGHQDAEADVLVSQTANGDTTAWCFTHYVDVCRAVVDAAESAAAEAQAADADALARLDGSQPPAAPADVPPGLTDADMATLDPPDLSVATFRPEGDQPVQGGLGGPETGDPGEAGSEPTPAAAEPGGAADTAPA